MGNICEKNYGIGLIIMNKSINIFVLNWNGLGVIDECLNSLKKISYHNSKIILIDNGSEDNSVTFISKKYPKVKVLEFDKLKFPLLFSILECICQNKKLQIDW